MLNVIRDDYSYYELMGGQEGIRRLVDQFYDIMDTAPEAAQIRALHAPSLKHSRDKLFMFLVGWSGGPQLYLEKFGHPRLRARHMPFPIGDLERDQWLWCMGQALDESGFPEQLVAHLKGRFAEIADMMKNKK